MARYFTLVLIAMAISVLAPCDASAETRSADKSTPAFCSSDMPVEQQYKHALKWFEQGGHQQSDVFNFTICVAQAAFQGYAPAETLVGRIDARIKTGPFDPRSRPVYFSHPDALYWFEKAASKGDGQGALHAGQMYELGITVPTDMKRAREYYVQAVESGWAPARKILEAFDDRPARIVSFEADNLDKARAGDKDSLRRIGEAYFYGDPYIRDVQKSVEWLEKAAAANSGAAQQMLGFFYVDGIVLPFDANRAVDLLVAASSNRAGGALELPRLYHHPDTDETRKQLIRNSGAMRRLYELNGMADPLKSPPPERGYGNAFEDISYEKLEEKAAKGDAEARFEVAVRFIDGDGVKPNIQKAVAMLSEIAPQHPAAAMNLGDIYFTGRLGQKDYVEALKWYVLAAINGDLIGARNAAIIYRDGGFGVAPDPIKAYAMASMSRHIGKSIAEKLDVKLTPEQRLEARVFGARRRLGHPS